jgi:hypothetical protein
VIFVDQKGAPWVMGKEPWTDKGKDHHGDPRLRPADSYSNFLGLQEIVDDRQPVIPAAPGWTVALACALPGEDPLTGEDPEVEVWVQAIAAWRVNEGGDLCPYIVEDSDTVAAGDWEDCENTALIGIFAPGERPDDTALLAMARKHYKISMYLERHATKHASEIPAPPVEG